MFRISLVRALWKCVMKVKMHKPIKDWLANWPHFTCEEADAQRAD